MPKVSIIVPTFNRAHLIVETIESVRNQTFSDWECIVVDDGSTDETADVMTAIIANDSRFQYVHRPGDRKKGANACRNFGFEISKGEYIKWFDSDDLMHRDMLSNQVSLLESERNLDFVACLGYYFTGSLDNLEPFDAYTKREEGNLIYNFLVKGLYFPTPAPLWKKSFFDAEKLFDETLSRHQDYDFHFRAICRNPKYIYSGDRLFFVRRGNADSISTNAPKNKAAQNSVIRVFDNVYDTILKLPQGKTRTDLLNHVAHRQLLHLYSFRVQHGAGLRETYAKSRPIISKIFKYNNFGFARNVKIVAGLLLLSAGKGYGWLYLREFNLVKREN